IGYSGFLQKINFYVFSDPDAKYQRVTGPMPGRPITAGIAHLHSATMILLGVIQQTCPEKSRDFVLMQLAVNINPLTGIIS
ncbi:MAG: hypothetical protein AB2613_04715, partial [Candidatus Thiodiazotropha taylori]